MKSSPQLTLGEIILKMEAIPQFWETHDKKREERTVRFDFEYLRPTKLMSWRGIYAELSFGFTGEGSISYSEVLQDLKSAIGKTFCGYKGGDFVMGRQTPVWVANCGNVRDTGIVDVVADDYSVILKTAKCESY